MNAPQLSSRGASPKPRPITVGDVVRLADNDQGRDAWHKPVSPGRAKGPEVKKHLQVVVEVIDGRAYVAPIFTDRSEEAKACTLMPADMPRGILDRPSYLAYDYITIRSLEGLQRDVDRGKVPKVASCPRATWLRIRTALRAPDTDLQAHIRRALRPEVRVGRVLEATSGKVA